MAQAAFPFALSSTSPAHAAPARPGRSQGAALQALSHPLPQGIDQAGFEIGWDHARYHLTPPVAHLHAASPVRQGWQAGRAAWGNRTLKPGAAARQWLALRLTAWQHGQAFEAVQVNPHFLAQIDATHCPVTRLPLLLATGRDDDAVVQRLNVQAAYAAGNLVVTSRAAERARQGLDCHALMARVHQALEAETGQLDGLSADAWQRLAVLSSFATPLPHGVAASLPLRVLPPNRVRVINPVQALQVMLTLQFTQGGYARRLLTLAALMPNSDARQAFQIFMHTLLARRLDAGQGIDAQATRRAMEDSWADTLVNRRWQRLALRLSPADCELLLERASRRGLCVGGGRWLSTAAATDGWQLAEGAGAPAARSARSAQPATATRPADAPGAATVIQAAQQALDQAANDSANGVATGSAISALSRGSQNLAS